MGYFILIVADQPILALAVETSGRTGSVALCRDGDVLAEAEFPHGLQHAAGIVSIIDGLCRQAGWRPGDIRHVYVSAGPGSFTGLRIGVTFAKTLAFALGARIVAVPTARVLAENAPADARHVVIVLDAKRDQIYTARYERTADGWTEREPAHVDALCDVLAHAPRPVHLIGEGIPFHRRFVPADDPGVVITEPPAWLARAAAVARIGRRMALAGDFADPWKLTPIYIRPPEAEEKRLRRPAGMPPEQ